MKPWKKSRINFCYILAFFVLCFGVIYYTNKNTYKTIRKEYNAQLKAAELMNECIKAVAQLRTEKGIPFNSEFDPNLTGFIGEEYTELFTSSGDEKAKRTSTNPNFAAYMVRVFTELDLKKGDVIAIGASGSFPALITATLCACKSLDLIPLLTYSFGASSFGATIPELTFYHMLQRFNELDLLPYKLIAASLGGNRDLALKKFFYENSKEVMDALVRSTGVHYIYYEDLSENIQARLKLYEDQANGKEIKCYVNVGGNDASFGMTSYSLLYPNGLVKDLSYLKSRIPTSPERGLIFEYILRGVPVVNFLNIKQLAISIGLPIDPVPLPSPGDGGVYYDIKKPKLPTILLFTLLIVAFIYSGIKKKTRRQIFDHASLIIK